ncbi:MAG: TIGR00730 family Rossman fold protein [Symbiopectobacterium sp.]
MEWTGLPAYVVINMEKSDRHIMVMGNFCGSSTGSNTAFIDAARMTGKTLAQAGIAIVYGGGRVELMGAVADAVLTQGGEVIGVMPRFLAYQELYHPGLTTLHVVENIHERKAKMAQIADGFIAMPGGSGALEEIFEQWTWRNWGFVTNPARFSMLTLFLPAENHE